MTCRLQFKRITYALRRLHANPSDWIKIRQSKDCLIFLVHLQGSENICYANIFTARAEALTPFD